jgi:hypothetical protein
VIITIKAQWQEHSLYKGAKIYKRLACTGTGGGTWKAVGTTCPTLASAKRQVDREEGCGSLHHWTQS